MSPLQIAGQISEAFAAEQGKSLAQRIAQGVENRQLLQLAHLYRDSSSEERALLAEHIAQSASPERLMDALLDTRQGRAQVEPGRHAGRVVAMGRGSRYEVRVPEGYSPDRAWPVHISLHGGGGNPMRNCEMNWRGEPSREGVILVCPSTPGGYWWMPQGEETILATLRDVMQTFRVDTDRVSIGGASSGGYGTWFAATKYPWLFRAAMPRCAATPRDEKVLGNLADTPIYMLHGLKDGTINVFQSQRSHQVLANYGYDVTFQEVPGVGHRFMSSFNEEALGWLEPLEREHWQDFRYRTSFRGSAPERVHWLRVDWGDAYKPGLELEGRMVTRRVGERHINEVHIQSSVPLRGFTVLMPPGGWQTIEPVQVFFNGEQVLSARVPSSAEAVLWSWMDHRDASLMTDRALRVDLEPLRGGPPLGMRGR